VEMDMKDELGITVERLTAAAGMLEQAAERLVQRQSAFDENAEASISRIVATVEARHEGELEEKLAAAELKIAELQARGVGTIPGVGRKTLPATAASLFAKQGMAVDSMDASALDAALVSLSLEQRIAVKAQLMRAGLLG
jgi:endonuclease III